MTMAAHVVVLGQLCQVIVLEVVIPGWLHQIFVRTAANALM